jgi:hypothetical protein
MFPKLLETKKWWVLVVMVVLVLTGCIAAIGVLKSTIGYLGSPNDGSLRDLFIAGAVLLLSCAIGLCLVILDKRRVARFDPNLTDQQERIELGRSRAVTRVAFEKMQEKPPTS